MSSPDTQRMMSPREYAMRIERDESSVARWLLFGIFGVVISFIIWSIFADIETVTRADGKVIPSSKVKIVQHFEGGIVQEIIAEEGELVDIDQPLIIIDNTKAESELESVRTRAQYSLAKVARLNALITLASGDDTATPAFPDDVDEQVKFQESIAFDSAKAEFEANIVEFEKKLDQREQKKASIYQELALRQQQIDLLGSTIAAYENLKGARAVSRLDMEAKQNQLIETKLTVSALRAQLPIIDSETKELHAQRKKYIESFRYESAQQMNDAQSEANSSTAMLKDRVGALSRTEVTSPIAGIVNELYVTAPGEVIKPGGEVAEIVPVEDKFIAEVLISPAEIGFVEVGQQAKIKVSAFDSMRYGSLEALVTNISSDTIKSPEKENQEFYRVRLSTDEILLDRAGKELTITAGMTVSVDIITGSRTVAEYILLPIMRGLEGSLRQR